MKNLFAPARAAAAAPKLTLTKTTVARFAKAQAPAGLPSTFNTSDVTTTSVF